jgi:hypothetical protein
VRRQREGDQSQEQGHERDGGPHRGEP